MKANHELTLELWPGSFAVCKLNPTGDLPGWATSDLFWFSTTPDETTVVCIQDQVPQSVQQVGDWRCFRISGTLDFSETGIIAGIANCLANENISVFAMSTYDTDYFLVPQSKLELAINAFRNNGYPVKTEDLC